MKNLNILSQKKNDSALRRDYSEWAPLKCRIHNGGRFRTFSEGQIWRCVTGENVGVEINGKGSCFLRPVFALKKNSRLGFICIPLTTQAHEGHGYIKFNFKEKEVYAVLSQIRNISVFRLLRKKGEADDLDVKKIKSGLKEYLGL